MYADPQWDAFMCIVIKVDNGTTRLGVTLCCIETRPIYPYTPTYGIDTIKTIVHIFWFFVLYSITRWEKKNDRDNQIKRNITLKTKCVFCCLVFSSSSSSSSFVSLIDQLKNKSKEKYTEKQTIQKTNRKLFRHMQITRTV